MNLILAIGISLKAPAMQEFRYEVAVTTYRPNITLFVTNVRTKGDFNWHGPNGKMRKENFASFPRFFADTHGYV